MLDFARLMMIFGLLLILVGGITYLIVRYGQSINKIPLGRLPGDFRIQGENFTCFIPLVSSILLSIVLTIVLNVIIRFLNR